jgi:transaldolase
VVGGQRVWIEGLTREMIRSGELAGLRDRGAGGATVGRGSIARVVRDSDAYDADIRRAADGRATERVARLLLVEDVRAAADLLRPVYEGTAGDDGYVCVELPPDVAHDTERIVTAAGELWTRCDRPNVLVEVPATERGLPAVEMLLIEGIGVSVTLVASVRQYQQVVDAFLRALEARLLRGGRLTSVTSFASVPVSRIDARVDGLLSLRLADAAAVEERPTMEALLGETGVAGARLAYREFQRRHAGARWERLADQGARPQRCLWGGAAGRRYAEGLALPDTVATMPPDAFAALVDSPPPALTGHLPREGGGAWERASRQLRVLDQLGIDAEELTDELAFDAGHALARSNRRLLEAIEAKIAARGWDRVSIASEESFPASDAPGWAGYALGPPAIDRGEGDQLNS